MDAKKENIKKFVAAGILCFLLLILILSKCSNKKKADLNTVTIESNGSTYDSKLAAYKANKKLRQEEESRRIYRQELSLSNPDEETKESEPLVQEQQLPEQATKPVAPVQTGTASSGYAKKTRQNEELNKLQQAIKDEQPAESIPERQEKNSSSSAPTQAETEKEKRRRSLQAWNQTKSATPSASKTYQAVIHKTQTVTAGKMATFRTKEKINAGSITIPANTLVYGKVSIGQNRLNISITSVAINKNVYPVNFTVLGTDGAPGIPVQVDNVQNAANQEVGNEVIQTTRRHGGIVGDVLGGIASAVKREKEISCTLIDNQTIYLQIN